MEGRLNIIFLILAVSFNLNADAFTISKRSTGECPGVLACLAPVQVFLDLIESDDVKTLHTLAYPAVLDQVCGQRENVSACLQTTYCSVYEVSYKGVAVTAAMDHICTVGRSDFLSEVKCFAKDRAYDAVDVCSKILIVAFDIYSVQIDSNTAEPAGFCKTFDSFLKCVHSGIERECTTKAAEVITTTYRESIQPMTTRVGCTLAST